MKRSLKLDRCSFIIAILVCLSFSVILPISVYADGSIDGMWTWVSGPKEPNKPGVYGTKGIPEPANIPGPKTKAVSWTDTDGNLWLFGGGDGTFYLAFNDLWKYDITDDLWTWMCGSNIPNQPGVYGTKGTPSSANVPGGREGSISWTDNNGNFWLFGGVGYDGIGIPNYLSDLWKYDPITGLWTWVGGESRPSTIGYYGGYYGTKGVAAVANWPGGREGGITWVDSSGNLWLFGGVGWYSSSFGDLNDLWKYDLSTGLWTWVSGSNVGDQYGVYGTKGVANPNNSPGGRRYSVSWKDDSDNLWLFGGHGYATTGGWVVLNDLWKFDGANWTWVSGFSIGDQPGVYGTKGVASPTTIPGAKRKCFSWADHNGNFWLFGEKNDLWKYNLATGLWTWVSGVKANQMSPAASYGTKGVASSDAWPGGRTHGLSWVDSSGNLWLFGGEEGYTNQWYELSDLWKFGAGNNATNQFGNISGKKNTKLTVSDPCGVSVTFSLTGGGYGEVNSVDYSFSQVILHDTGEKSQLTISTKGKTTTSVGDIIVNGSLKGIMAKTTNLLGSITVTGSLGTLTLDDVADSHTITIGSSANPKAGVTMKFDQVSDLTINSQMPIKSITAAEWLAGDINAPSVGSITAKGDKKRAILGDFDVDVTTGGVIGSVKVAGTLSGTWDCNIVKSITAAGIDGVDLTLSKQPDAKVPALGKLAIKNWITSSQIQSAGNIGTITTGGIADSICFAGVISTRDVDAADGVLDLPDPALDINYDQPATIKSLSVKGIKSQSSPYAINSNFAAANILSASLCYPQNDNSGVPFGVAADYIKKLTIKEADGTSTLKELDNPGDGGTPPGDAEIRLY